MLMKMLWKIWAMCMVTLFALMSVFCDRSQVAAVQQCGTRGGHYRENLTLNVKLGETAVLPCTLETILERNQQINWRRGSGDSLVKCTTPYICTYYRPHDSRFHIVTDYEKEFKLNITNAQLDDTSTYYCDLYIKSSHSCEASKVSLNVTEQYVSPVNESSTVSIISSTAISEMITTNLPNEYSSTPISGKRHETFIYLTMFIATLLILMLFAAICCCLLVKKFEIHLRPRNSSSRCVNTDESNVLEMTRRSSVLPAIPTVPSPSKDTAMPSDQPRGNCNSSSKPSFESHLGHPQKPDADIQRQTSSDHSGDLTSQGKMIQTYSQFDEKIPTDSGHCVSLPKFGSEESCSGECQSGLVPIISPLKVTRTYFSTSPKLPLESTAKTARESDGSISISNGTNDTPSLCVNHLNKRNNDVYTHPVDDEEHTYLDMNGQGPPVPPMNPHKMLPSISSTTTHEHDAVQPEPALAESATSQSSPISMDGHTWHNFEGDRTRRAPAENFRKYIQSRLSFSIRHGHRETRARPDIVDFPSHPPLPTSIK
ncbi:uncharacterized protein LOC105441468 [Strongylocentrotus purpuratus]|uniref:Ig-like domain-containing protein n=1 Tax=Strongylocentrotus purpuratus TaxID=7668 RepID=A0A7M7N8L7_STRPU|nr:uncharacterized protein LOC105441468 [Strongylocentrotus purpuratus]